MADPESGEVGEEELGALRQRLAEALETVPRLTRAVFLLRRLDDLPYEAIAWRCGISVDEVTSRMADALVGMRRYADEGRAGLAGRLRQALRPCRDQRAKLRRIRVDRSLGISPAASEDDR